MAHIVLTEEQARVLAATAGTVDVRDPQGRTVATLTPLSPEDMEGVERFRRRPERREPSIPADQVEAHLRRLEEIRQSEGMDEAKMLHLLRRMHAAERG